MAKYTINRGSTANDGTGDNLRAGADKVNLNFDEIYLEIGDGTTLGGKIIPGKIEGTNFDDSLLVGHSTTGTLSTAEDNTGVGIRALQSITSGDQNTAVGTEALQSVTTSKYNTAVGVNALNNQSTGVSTTGYNVAVGRSALQITTGAYNVGVGGGAGHAGRRRGV